VLGHDNFTDRSTHIGNRAEYGTALSAAAARASMPFRPWTATPLDPYETPWTPVA
jgi:hypothetical protein